MNLIDEALTAEQFEALPAELVGPLCEATDADFREWGARLVAAAEAGDETGRRQAIHALKGLCGNYGADALLASATGALDDAAARDALTACVEATIRAVLAAAAPFADQ